MVIEEQVKNPKPHLDNPNKKKFKNPCRVHNGGHEWDDCRQNRKSEKNMEKTRITIVIAADDETKVTEDLMSSIMI
jgi:hypothetical protein